MDDAAWPELALPAWRDTCDTLHMYAQIVGKVRLALAYPQPQWAHVPLYVTVRGLTTGPIPYRGAAFQIDFDFLAHELQIVTAQGDRRTIALEPRSVRDFHRLFFDALRSLNVDVTIWDMPVEIPNPIRFTDDTVHASYDREYVERFRRVLISANDALERYRAPFRGRHTQVQFFWGTFDLAYARFTGRSATPPSADVIMREAMDAEEVCAGFWPGDDRFPEPAFWCYAYPKPEDLEKACIRPPEAAWNAGMGEFILRYGDVRRLPSPGDAVHSFFESAYEAWSSLARKDVY